MLVLMILLLPVLVPTSRLNGKWVKERCYLCMFVVGVLLLCSNFVSTGITLGMTPCQNMNFMLLCEFYASASRVCVAFVASFLPNKQYFRVC